MKTIIGILLVGLLGLLGCSGNNDGTTTVDQAIPVVPFGLTDTTTPTYEWTPVSGATRYRLIVQDTNQEAISQNTQETAIIDEWYTAEEADCVSEDTLCSATPEIEVADNTWKVLACAGEACGLWSDELQFSYNAEPMRPRFIDNGDGTVSDQRSHLMWSKVTYLSGAQTWEKAKSYCENLVLAGHEDWQLPRLTPLRYLLHPVPPYPALPDGHPFEFNVNDYWSTTCGPGGQPGPPWHVNLWFGTASNDYILNAFGWCQRRWK